MPEKKKSAIENVLRLLLNIGKGLAVVAAAIVVLFLLILCSGALHVRHSP